MEQFMNMNHLVPDFGMEDEYSIPASAGLSRPIKSSMAEEDIMELLWLNGQVVMQGRNQTNQKKSPPISKTLISDAILPPEQELSTLGEIQSSAVPLPDDESAAHLFIQEDEMASWLHYPSEDASFDRDFCSDFFYPSAPTPAAPTVTATPSVRTATPSVRTATPSVRTATEPPLMAMAATKPPTPPVKLPAADVDSSRFTNFVHFSRNKGRGDSGPSHSHKAVRESTIVDSCVTPTAIVHNSRVPSIARKTCEINGITSSGRMSGAAAVGTSSAGGEMVTGDMTVTSSPDGSGGSVSISAEPTHKPPVASDHKRKARQAADEADCFSEDVECEPADAKKQVHGSTSTKRSRAAEVHNLSERRRRDRINEKMKALQELIPRCNKSDKASMLDEAIEYLKSLQLQVQMMSMGCSMVPMMFPGMQQYMPPMGMGMGMGMDMSMSRPIMPFPSVLAGSAMPTPSAAAHLGPRFPMPAAYLMQPVPPPDPSRVQAAHQTNPMLNLAGSQCHNQQQLLPKFDDPYQRCFGLHQMQLPTPLNKSSAQAGTSKPSTNGVAENLEHQSG